MKFALTLSCLQSVNCAQRREGVSRRLYTAARTAVKGWRPVAPSGPSSQMSRLSAQEKSHHGLDKPPHFNDCVCGGETCSSRPASRTRTHTEKSETLGWKLPLTSYGYDSATIKCIKWMCYLVFYHWQLQLQKNNRATFSQVKGSAHTM